MVICFNQGCAPCAGPFKQKGMTMNKPAAAARLAVLDDDPVACEILRARIRAACPDVDVVILGEPVVVPGFDIYVIDNSFGGIRQGSRLAEAIATVAPQAALFILSSFLEVALLKRALGSTCRGAFEKGNPSDISSLVAAISEYVADPARIVAKRAQSRGMIADIAALIGEWNARLGFEERRRRVLAAELTDDQRSVGSSPAR
jgi:DNA-binding NarL/FixJ family response regulator